MLDQRDWNIWLGTQRERALQIMLGLVCLFGLVGVAYSAYRFIRDPAGQTNLVPYAVAWSTTLLLLLGRKIPLRVRAAGFALVTWGFAVFALLAGWLAGGGRGFLLALTSVTVVLLGPGAGLGSAVLALLTYAAFAVLYTAGWLRMPPMLDPVSVPPVVVEGIGFCLALGIVVTSQWLSGKAVTAASRAGEQARAAGELAAAREASFHNVVLRSSDGVLVEDGAGRVCFANPAVGPLLGRPADGLAGGPVPFAIPGDGMRDLRIGVPPHERVVELRATDTSWEGRPARLAMLRDVTERSRAAAEREELIAELEAKNTELERFTYTVSHDLKAPLITIRGYLGYLEPAAAAGDLERLRGDIARISQATERMRRLLEELLHLSHLGRATGPREPVAFARIVEEALEMVRGRLEARGVEIAVAEPLPVVTVDRARIVEVVQNLLDNSAKFMGGQAAPRIDVGTRGIDDRGRVVLFVRDNGNGIPAEHLDRVFGLFNKLDADSEGTGVGLAVARRIIEAHGGHLAAESPGAGPGLGATFVFSLPPAAGSTP